MNTSSMRPNTLTDIRRIIYNFKEGKFDRIKVAYLLVRLRYKTENPIIKDIAHFIAHEHREQGYSHRLAMRVLELNKEVLLTPPDKPIVLGKSVEPLVSQDVFVAEIEKCLQEIETPYVFDGKAFKFFKAVLANIEQATMFLEKKDSELYEQLKLSVIEHDPDGRCTIYFSLVPRPTNTGRINIGKNVAFEYVFMQALPAGIEPASNSRIKFNSTS